MATNFKVPGNLLVFRGALASAVCEWFLLFLLFVDAALSYLITKFARYCELPIPCILCSRLDHVFGNAKPGFYWDLVCRNHRTEISSLISCEVHDKLADGRGMCEKCLMSFVLKNKSNLEMHRLCLGKLGFDHIGCGPCALHSSSLNGGSSSSSVGTQLCLCCEEPWAPRQNGQRFLRLKPSNIGVSKPNIPLPRRLSRRDSLKKTRDKFSGQGIPRRHSKGSLDRLSHVGYTELKINSESESDIIFSDDEEGGSSVVRDISEHKVESIVQRDLEVPQKRLSQKSSPILRPDTNELHDVKCLASDVTLGNSPHKFNGQQPNQRNSSSLLPELISLDDIPPSSSDVSVPFGVHSLSQNSSASVLFDLISLVDTPPLVDVKEVPLEASPEKFKLPLEASPEKSANLIGTDDSRTITVNENEEALKSSTSSDALETEPSANDHPAANSTCRQPRNMHKSSVRGMNTEESGIVAEEPAICNGVNENLKSLPTQSFSFLGIQSSLNNLRPELNYHRSGSLMTDECHSGNQDIQTLVPRDRIEFPGFESVGGCSVTENEGESIVNRLKQQVEHDRQYIDELYKELEEERSASAIAANQAMAMITRLQEEKAALHMEALQYLRMMEEQSEYDVDALEKANDLLADKEKEIQDLEAELEFYRMNFLDEPLAGIIHDNDIKPEGRNSFVDNVPTLHRTNNDNTAPHESIASRASDSSNKHVIISQQLEFEDEKSYISQHLKKLAKKLHQYAQNETSPDISDGEYDEKASDGEYQEELLNGGVRKLSCIVEQNGLPVQTNLPVSNGATPTLEQSNASMCRNQAPSKDNGHACNGQNGSVNFRDVNIVTLENEISDLNDRLEALETDCNFLEYCSSTLQNGEKGLQFIRDIAHQLQELRNLGTKSRN